MNKPNEKPVPQPDNDNRANQLNPDHDAYWQSRGMPGRPAEPVEPAPPLKRK